MDHRGLKIIHGIIDVLQKLGGPERRYERLSSDLQGKDI